MVRALARLRLALTCVLLALVALLAVPQAALAQEKLVSDSSEDVVKPGKLLEPLAKPIDGAVAAHGTAVSAQTEVYEANREVLRLKGQGLDTTAAYQRLADARARLTTAIPQDIATDQEVNDRIADATKQARLERYGDSGPTFGDGARDAFNGAARRGFLTGLREGAGKALTGMASTVMHPVAAWDAVTKEANLTSEERASRLAAEDRASLTTKASEAIREVDDPAGVGFAKGERMGTAIGQAVTNAGVSIAAGAVAGRLVSAGVARLAAAGEEASAGAAPLTKPNVTPLEGAPKSEPIAKPPGEPLSSAPSEELCVAGGCFAGGTEIATALGERAIEDVRAGDEVLARDPETGETRFEHVGRTFVHPSEVVDLTFEDEAGRREHITATPEHPFHVVDGSFRPVSELSLGDVVDTATGIARVISLETLRDPVTVYNFEVENAHTYFVGKTRAWVHNCSQVNLGRPGTPGWLSRHEGGPPGGHLIEKHVGKTDEQLVRRSVLRKGDVSTFPDQKTAEAVAARTITENQTKIADWMRYGTDRKLNLTSKDRSAVTGRLVKAGSTSVQEVKGTLLVLRRDATMPTGWRVFTGYPIE
jgi:hypothetical protein